MRNPSGNFVHVKAGYVGMLRIICCFSLLIIMAGPAFLSAREKPGTEHVLAGLSMGTYYRVILADVTSSQAEDARKEILAVLERINQSMSVFDPQSEVSRFNRIMPGEKLCVSSDLVRTLQVSFRANELTRGAFDPTLGAIIDLWGFGPDINIREIPERPEIEAALKGLGLDKIFLDEKGCLSKSHPRTKLNLSGVAKGYGVDAVAGVLRQMGIFSFLVDIGGDIYVGTKKPDGSLWRVGISAPHPGAGGDDLILFVELEERAVASSGNYRNHFVRDGHMYGHIIVPSTGRPVRSRIVSATVAARTCVMADALATAAMVMKPDKALALVEEPDIFEVILMEVDDEGELSVRGSR